MTRFLGQFFWFTFFFFQTLLDFTRLNLKQITYKTHLISGILRKWLNQILLMTFRSECDQWLRMRWLQSDGTSSAPINMRETWSIWGGPITNQWMNWCGSSSAWSMLWMIFVSKKKKLEILVNVLFDFPRNFWMLKLIKDNVIFSFSITFA